MQWWVRFFLVQPLSRIRLLVIPWTAARQVSLFFTISQSLLKLTSFESMMPSNHPILCCPLLLPPSIFPSIRVFSNESVLRIRWPKYWSFGISPFSEYSGLTSFRIDWFAFLAVQGTLRSLLQHHILHLVLDSVLNGCSTIQGVSVSSSAHFDESYLSRKLFIS